MTGFEKNDLTGFLETIGNKLDRKIEAFLIGGGAMVLRNQKNATKDLDLVFHNQNDCKEFSRALRSLGFKAKFELELAYEEMKADGIFDDGLGRRIDLFTEKVCGALKLSRKIIARSQPLELSGNLSIRVFSNEDVILFKGITNRTDDLNDIAAIVRASNPNWDTVLDECTQQGKTRDWSCALYDKFAQIKDSHEIDVPITRKLLRMCRKRMVRDAFDGYLKEGKTRAQALVELKKKGFSKKELEQSL